MILPEQEQDQDRGHAGDVGLKNGQGQERGGLRSYWSALPRIGKVLTVALPTIAAVVGILAPLGLIGPRPVPAQPAGYFQGAILGQTGVPVRKTAERSGSAVAVLQPGTPVFIVCTKEGDAVAGPRHGGGTITTRVWDYIRTATSPGPLGFVPDALVNTYSMKPKGHSC